MVTTFILLLAQSSIRSLHHILMLHPSITVQYVTTFHPSPLRIGIRFSAPIAVDASIRYVVFNIPLPCETTDRSCSIVKLTDFKTPRSDCLSPIPNLRPPPLSNLSPRYASSSINMNNERRRITNNSALEDIDRQLRRLEETSHLLRLFEASDAGMDYATQLTLALSLIQQVNRSRVPNAPNGFGPPAAAPHPLAAFLSAPLPNVSRALPVKYYVVTVGRRIGVIKGPWCVVNFYILYLF